METLWDRRSNRHTQGQLATVRGRGRGSERLPLGRTCLSRKPSGSSPAVGKNGSAPVGTSETRLGHADDVHPLEGQARHGRPGPTSTPWPRLPTGRCPAFQRFLQRLYEQTQGHAGRQLERVGLAGKPASVAATSTA